MRYVIIGGSIAGIAAARSIRANDPAGEIILVSDEKSKPYYRPMIPFLIEKEDIDVTFIEDPVETYRLTAVFGRAQDIDTKNKEVLLSSGEKLVFDRLLIATGSSPVIPQIKGITGEGAFTLRTIDDALAIRKYAAGKKEAVILGGGFVGIKAAVALKHAGLKVTVIEKLNQILPQRLDARGAQIIEGIIRESGISVITNQITSELVRTAGSVKSVRLASGGSVNAGMVVIATGVKPNIAFLKNTGIKTSKGILINENLVTSLTDIYAAGDVVEYIDIVTRQPAVSALWTNAEEMGKYAGKNMTGANIKYRGFLSTLNITEIFDVPFMSAGNIEPDSKDFEVVVEDNIDSYRKLIFKGDVLSGIILIGNITNAGIYTNLIRKGFPMGILKEEAIKGNLGYIHFLNAIPPPLLTV